MVTTETYGARAYQRRIKNNGLSSCSVPQIIAVLYFTQITTMNRKYLITVSRKLCRMPPCQHHCHCYQCGSAGHLLRECPGRVSSAATQSSPSTRVFSLLGKLQELFVSLIHRVETLEGSALSARPQNPSNVPPSPSVYSNLDNDNNLNKLSQSLLEIRSVSVHPGVDTPNPPSPAPSITPQFSLEDFCRSIGIATPAVETNGLQPMEV